ncbi:hypothetical protein DE146DRAFT_194836 [Phaeosphaeria sp. MPI-PUGE-AT-0046c]|nr:hypothetical protein DE146DRAFT_194836 [Phaeosphaeria sp. MPI-PUGE-AT-0046c]
MALSSSQIYVATYNTSAPKANTTGSARNPLLETTSSSRWRFGRSTTNLREPESRVSSSTGSSSSIRRAVSPVPSIPKIERSSSKMSLFNLFSKPKVEKARGHTEVGLAVPMRPQTPPKPAPVVSTPKSSLRQNPSPSVQQSIRARSSQIFRPMSMRPQPPPSKEAKEFGSWEPPPLFQAFPQSVKHATVQACIFAPEVLMRTQSQRRQAELLRERIDSARDLSIITEDGADPRNKLEKSHRRLISNSVLNPPALELVNKIYILVTSGFVLQYAGDGSFDRMPEKVLKLGKDSAAFACDLIPGKHWVLQISSHALDDGTSEAGPRNSLLSRLRSQNAITRKAATSFLLVLESAEEMDAWMTVVRKEIDNQGGNRVKGEASRASSSTDDTRDSRSIDTTSHRYLVQRDSKAPSKIVPVDSPLQSQYSSPRVLASEWESGQSDRAPSIAESSSGHSYRLANQRQSIETLSIATTPVSQDQIQLDSLRSRSRFSYMSSSSISGPGTRNTSRDSSPAPRSPMQDGSSPAVEQDSLRSAMSLKSFHMNPTNSVASRRRSMQPLPVTNEHFVPSVERPGLRQRHSLYGPASPTMLDEPQLTTTTSIAAVELSTAKQTGGAQDLPPLSSTGTISRSLHSYGRRAPTSDALAQAPLSVDVQAQPNARSYSAQGRRDIVSPPPSVPAPAPPVSASHPSLLVEQPRFSLAMASVKPQDGKTQHRISSNPKPFLRPIPVRPQQQHADRSKSNPRRLSSLTPTPSAAPQRFSVNRSVTAPVQPSHATNPGPTSHPNMLDANGQTLPPRRPMSVQTRTSPAPFLLSTSRPVRAIASTPSFVPSTRRTSNPQLNAPDLRSAPEQPLQAEPKFIASRRSMASYGLPPPAPPPTMPLPTLPPNAPLPPPPPMMPLPPVPASDTSFPGPPPNMPLPAPPTTALSTSISPWTPVSI